MAVDKEVKPENNKFTTDSKIKYNLLLYIDQSDYYEELKSLVTVKVKPKF